MSETATAAPVSKVDIEALVSSITQREWLQICRTLEAGKEDVIEQAELMFPALLWVHRKHAHGGADWDKVLDLTDGEVFAELGITDDDAEAAPEGKESTGPVTSDDAPSAAESPSPAPVDGPTAEPSSRPNGDSVEHGFASPPLAPSPSMTT